MNPVKEHPNAVVGGGAGLAGGTAVIELLDSLGVSITGPQGALIAGGLTTVALLVGRHGIRGIFRTLWRGSTAVLLVLVLALLLVGSAQAKKPVHQAAASATVTATWADGKLTLAGCGFAIAPVQVDWTLPDQSVQVWWIGMWNDDEHGRGCLDNNYIPATMPGEWRADVYQDGVLAATATAGVG